VNRRFAPGSNRHVRRPPGYYHHGIYISDDRVIQFGSGVTLRNKGGTAINAVSLADFENGGTAGVVRHGYSSWLTGWHPPADEPWKTVERAEFLLKLQPNVRYNLIGHNCEIIANVCVSGAWTESYQVRRFFGVRAIGSAAFLFWLGRRSRANLPLPRWALAAGIVWVASGIGTIALYNHQIKQLWAEIRDDWFAHERLLDEDPRKGLTD
jgi:hypothetical protein